MARSRRYGIARDVFKVVKIAARLSRDLSNVAEEASSSQRQHKHESVHVPTPAMAQENEAYERKVLKSYGGNVARKIYVKLVGVSYANADGSSRQRVLRNLVEGQVLVLKREAHNPHDPNSILVCTADGLGAGHLDRRLAGDVTRSMSKGHTWVCHFRRLVQAPGTKTAGGVVCLIKVNYNKPDSSNAGLSGTEFLAKHYPDYKPITTKHTSPPTQTQEGHPLCFCYSWLSASSPY